MLIDDQTRQFGASIQLIEKDNENILDDGELHAMGEKIEGFFFLY
jgi:hypothetical protein